MTIRMLLIVILLGLFLFSCDEVDDIDDDIGFSSGCVGCHTDKELLAEIAEPIEDSGGETAGEG